MTDDEMYSPAIEALADVWASMDRNLEEFRASKNGPDDDGVYEGYMSEAREFIKRLAECGYLVVPK